MRTLIWVMVALLIGFFAGRAFHKWEVRQNAQVMGEAFEDNYAKGIADAKTNNKKVFLYFGMNGCQPCANMKSFTLADPTVKAKLAGYVFVEVNGPFRPDLATKWGVGAYPTYMVIDGDEKAVGNRMVGYTTADQFLAWLP